MTEISQDQDNTVYTHSAGERLTVDHGVTIAPGGHGGHEALVAQYADNVVINFGSIIGDRYGVVLSGDGDRLVNKTDGYIHGADAGIFVQDPTDAVITNRGHIDSSGGLLGSGIETKGGLTLDNQGVISGVIGLSQTDGYSGDVAVTNSGLIDGRVGISLNAGSNLTVENTGTIRGENGSLGADHLSLTNSGEIDGDISGSFVDLTISNSGVINAFIGPYAGSHGAISITNTGEFNGDISPPFSALTIDNSGTMNGSLLPQPYAGASVGVVSIANTGQIKGDLTLSAFADLYDGGGGHLSGFVNGLAGNDTLIGGSDADTLIGGRGADRLDGGAGGGDTFIYNAASESTGAKMDVVAANWSDSDRIDLSAIDADKGTRGQQHADFVGEIGAGDATHAGELAYYHQGGDTYVVLDRGAHGPTVIEIAGEVTLTADNFVV